MIRFYNELLPWVRWLQCSSVPRRLPCGGEDLCRRLLWGAGSVPSRPSSILADRHYRDPPYVGCDDDLLGPMRSSRTCLRAFECSTVSAVRVSGCVATADLGLARPQVH